MLKNLDPKSVWQHFEAINAIPRASTKEHEITAYMDAFGKSLGLETVVDAIGNVIIKKPGTLRKENHRTVILQGHLDMVHQKEPTSNFDFNTQGIQMYVDGDWVKAKETTLGADNGIGVAAIMAVLSSKDMPHPPIEALFTIDEEKGMTGAMALTPDQLSGKLLLNLDSEEDDEITIGCAGGVDVEISGSYERQLLNIKEYKLFEISLTNLSGGHSGVDIHLNKGNAILIMAQCLKALVLSLEVRLHTFNAGTLTNVIPRNSTAIIALRDDKFPSFKLELEKILKKLKKQYQITDPDLNIIAKPVQNSIGVMDLQQQTQLLDALINMPNGVFKMTEGIEGLVQTSNNIAIATIANGSFKMGCHTRSSVDADRSHLVGLIENCFYFAKVEALGPYPGWQPRPDSELLAIAKKCYEKMNGTTPAIKSIHAGLECGIIAGVFPKMQMISIGPNVLGAHSPDERLQISSTKKFWSYLSEILRTIE